MKEFGEALKVAATTRSLHGLAALALVALVAVIGLTYFAPIIQLAKFVLVPAVLLIFLGIFFYTARRTPRVPPQAGESYYESLVNRGIVYGDDGHLVSIEQIRQVPMIANPQQQMLPSPKEEEHPS
jgi:hypothetical protein